MTLKARKPFFERVKEGLEEGIAHAKGERTLRTTVISKESPESKLPKQEQAKPKWDSRLIGTWKSDRRRTFQNFKPKTGFDPKKFRKLKSLFGKLTIRWGRGKCYTELGEYRDSENYEIIARDSNCVIVRLWSEIYEEFLLQRIHFEGEFYSMALGGGLCEYFRRIS